jgi:ferredoxin
MWRSIERANQRMDQDKMKVRVDASICQGHARCAAFAPQVFRLDEQGHSFVQSETVPRECEELVRKAALSCPERAIVVTQKDE